MTRLTPGQGAALVATVDRIIESHAASTDQLPRRGDDVESRETANRHAAGRAALSHLEHVLKIATRTGEDAPPAALALLAAARAEINEESPEADDAGEPC